MRIDMKEQIVRFSEQRYVVREYVEAKIGGIVCVKIYDPVKATF